MNHSKKLIIILFLLLLLNIAGCNHPGAVLPPSPTAFPSVATQIATETPSALTTSVLPEMEALEKNSIEFYRNGKTYEVVIGYSLGDAFWNVTPQPALPKKYEEMSNGSPRLIGYGDFDQDGETEFYVNVSYCGANCTTQLRLYKYDPAQDQFIVVDEVRYKHGLLKYKDLNQDGNPELIFEALGYNLYGDQGYTLFSVVTVLRYENGKLIEVTGEFPEVIANDADSNLAFSKTDGDNQGVAEHTLAVYLYDMYRLGKLDEARPNFDQICNEVVKPRKEKEGNSFDCLVFRAEVEADIQKYEQSKSHK